MNWFYHDGHGKKYGPINDKQLRFLVMQKKIVPDTILETETGQQGKARQIKGLFVNNITQPNKQVAKTPSITSQSQSRPQSCNQNVPTYNDHVKKHFFCTNCGNVVLEQAIACMVCGASPIAHHKFCRNCGASLNPEQIVCIKCGLSVNNQKKQETPCPTPTYAPVNNIIVESHPRSKTIAALLALFFGGIGIHKFYLGSWGWGILYLLFLFFTAGYGGILTGLIAFIEAIVYISSSEESFVKKYPRNVKSPFRW